MLENNIPVLKWASSSPDLSPIETLWHIMKNKQAGNSFTAADSQKLVHTMSRRIKSVLSQIGDVSQ